MGLNIIRLPYYQIRIEDRELLIVAEESLATSHLTFMYIYYIDRLVFH